jgi:hypothetical protein
MSSSHTQCPILLYKQNLSTAGTAILHFVWAEAQEIVKAGQYQPGMIFKAMWRSGRAFGLDVLPKPQKHE